MRNWTKWIAGLLLLGIGPAGDKLLAHLPDEATRIYTLISGSQLTDD